MPPASLTADGSSPHTTPVHPPLGEQAITVVLPADFAAFCQLHHEIYQHFAHHLLANHDTAADAVQRALGDLAASWNQALAGHHTTAIAWEALTHRIQRAHTPANTPASALYALVPAAEADAAVLHRIMRLSITTTAATLGTESTTVTSLLATFDRRLAAGTATALRACWRAARQA
ncbi:hypothetical protein Scani_34040 [Streptomyces caniferus]|uniref:Uncharacterized protein n=1 Tax=Streptomyces caniferus TaxID=285557 RepID=A0A640S9M6_9ACTN|nr:hypothetical protein [Streptomyces caniferus]GFE07136.1 hypothetical protein Scani_34040 [Streptomyces caniferus]